MASQTMYRGDSGNTRRVFPFQVLLWLQSTGAQLASSESLFFQYRLFRPLKGYTSPLLPPLYTPVAPAELGHGVAGHSKC